MSTLLIAKRFRGPAGSANGGYFAGSVAVHAGQTMTVRLLCPPPLDTPLEVQTHPDGTLSVVHDGQVIATAQPTRLSLSTPPAPQYFEAVEASRRYAGFKYHRFPGCFVCGTERPRGDGMRIFAGTLPERGLVAAPWVPDASLDQGDGKVRAEFMSAALDCPGFYAVSADDRMMLLGEMTAHVNRRAHIGERCTVIGWAIESQGRRHGAGTAVYGEDGDVCGSARSVWIEPSRRA